MQVTSTYLEPGSYVFKLVNSSSDRHIVQIFNADESHLITTILAVPDYRVQVSGHSAFRMWETPAGYVSALRSWYYPGDNFGQEFPYPKNLRQLEVAQVQTAPAPQAPVAEAAPPPPAPAPETAQAEEQPAVVARNMPPPGLPPRLRSSPHRSLSPPVLPQTASRYPLFGFLGPILVAVVD